MSYGYDDYGHGTCRCRIERLEQKLAFLEGKESLEPVLGAQARRITELEIALATCRKVDGSVMVRPSEIGSGFRDDERVLASRPPKVIEIERHKHDCSCPE